MVGIHDVAAILWQILPAKYIRLGTGASAHMILDLHRKIIPLLFGVFFFVFYHIIRTRNMRGNGLVATTNLNLKFFNLSQPLYPHAILHSSVSACNLELSQHLLLSQHNCHYNTDDKCKHTYNHKSPWFL